jgi:hypothetical protein
MFIMQPSTTPDRLHTGAGRAETVNENPGPRADSGNPHIQYHNFRSTGRSRILAMAGMTLLLLLTIGSVSSYTATPLWPLAILLASVTGFILAAVAFRCRTRDPATAHRPL